MNAYGCVKCQKHHAERDRDGLAVPPARAAAPLDAHPDDGHMHSYGCRLCGVDFPRWVEEAREAAVGEPLAAGLREALLGIIGEAEEVTEAQHGTAHGALVAIIRRVNQVLALLDSGEQGGLDVERLADAMYEAGRLGLIYDGITTKDEAAVYAAVYNGSVEFDALYAARLETEAEK